MRAAATATLASPHRGGSAPSAAAPRVAPRPAPLRRGLMPPPRAARPSSPQPGDGTQPVMLNGQTLWLQEAGAERPVLYGDSYVLLPSPPPTAGGCATPAPAALRRRGAAAASAAGLVPWRHPGGGLAGAGLVVVPAVGETGIIPYGGEPVVLRGDGYVEAEPAAAVEVLPPEEPGAALAPPTAAPTTALAPRPAAAASAGIVQSPLGGVYRGEAVGEGAGNVYETSNTFSPRRGHKIKFTCNRCGATSIRPVNIHAWREGSVFARCGKCHVTHKLIDNLKLFHEMSGPVFDAPSPPLDPAAPLPPALELRLGELPGGGGVVGGFGGLGGWQPRAPGGGA